MDRLGKKVVICNQHTDGVQTRTAACNQNVYQKSDGSFWINDNFTQGGKRPVKLNASSGTFEYDFHIQTVKTSRPDFLKGLST